MSNLVLAEKYELQVKIPGKTAYDKKGQKKLVHKKKLVGRHFVESRNLIENNEHYITYEKETVELMKVREENIVKNAENAKKENMNMSDLVDAIKEPKKEESKEPKSVDDMGVKDLKKYCDDNDLKYHHKAGKEKLLEIIKS